MRHSSATRSRHFRSRVHAPSSHPLQQVTEVNTITAFCIKKPRPVLDKKRPPRYNYKYKQMLPQERSVAINCQNLLTVWFLSGRSSCIYEHNTQDNPRTNAKLKELLFRNAPPPFPLECAGEKRHLTANGNVSIYCNTLRHLMSNFSIPRGWFFTFRSYKLTAGA